MLAGAWRKHVPGRGHTPGQRPGGWAVLSFQEQRGGQCSHQRRREGSRVWSASQKESILLSGVGVGRAFLAEERAKQKPGVGL